MDWIIAEQIELWSLIGVTEREREQPTGLEVDLRLGLDLSPAGRSDELTDTLDYVAVVELVRETGAKEQCILLEALAEKIKQKLLLGLCVCLKSSTAYCNLMRVGLQ